MYERLAVVSIEDVFAAIRKNEPFVLNGHECGTESVRIRTYYVHGVHCVWDGCNCKGEYFAVERQIHSVTGKPLQLKYHLNFYGYHEDGHEVMMTSDHKVPKSQGGHKYDINNRQPMCGPHNAKKGNKLIYM